MRYISCQAAESWGLSEEAGGGSSRRGFGQKPGQPVKWPGVNKEPFPPPGMRFLAWHLLRVLFPFLASAPPSLLSYLFFFFFSLSARFCVGTIAHIPGGWRQPGLRDAPMHWHHLKVRWAWGHSLGVSCFLSSLASARVVALGWRARNAFKLYFRGGTDKM